ncbi:uncharacterized protein G2W53_011303 [Senna tora]|uniref:Uncharacterized protein n=1 Tax=Senna tora TaxID=362788 RepID=A0A835CAY4_9FABA|nr:uncharacterized protein G2W53_011303 [Senna tora]
MLPSSTTELNRTATTTMAEIDSNLPSSALSRSALWYQCERRWISPRCSLNLFRFDSIVLCFLSDSISFLLRNVVAKRIYSGMRLEFEYD